MHADGAGGRGGEDPALAADRGRVALAGHAVCGVSAGGESDDAGAVRGGRDAASPRIGLEEAAPGLEPRGLLPLHACAGQCAGNLAALDAVRCGAVI